MIPGIKAAPIFKWSEALKYKKQLLKNAEDARTGKTSETVYKTIVIDTADQACKQLESYVCEQLEIESMDKLGYGKAWAVLARMFDEFVQDFTKAGYAVVVISHSTQKTFDADGAEPYSQIQASLPKGVLEALRNFVDVVAYAESKVESDGSLQTYLYLRGNKTLDAGSRYKYLPDRIPFTYEALEEAVQKAVDAIAENAGKDSVTDKAINIHALEKPNESYEDLIAKIRKLNKVFRDNNHAAEYKAIVESQLGKDKLVKDCTEDQTEILTVIADDLQSKADELGLVVMAA